MPIQGDDQIQDAANTKVLKPFRLSQTDHFANETEAGFKPDPWEEDRSSTPSETVRCQRRRGDRCGTGTYAVDRG